MGPIKNIIFDFDGTLADTSKLIVATMQKSLKELGLPFRDEEQIKATIGVRLEEIPSILWPNSTGLGEQFAEIYRKNFIELKNTIQITLFPGVKETLLKLYEKGYRLCIATSRSHQSLEELTRQLGIIDLFVYFLGGDDVSRGKPDPESIYKILSEMEFKFEETLMMGDMKVDILMGKNAGIKTCGVTYGNGKENELKESGVDYIIHSFREMNTFL